ncbi:MAG: ribosomal subunit interface protein [Candidatus Puniceispirillum sp.]|nr:ribosomal subunit interface protein [Candidatus Pelagibacter sp.]MBA4283557.1 ribosomal subunit interface protein [Candidatus Puniceispirillum sp.]
MAIVISGKQMDLGESLRSHIENDITTTVSRYIDGDIDATVTVSKDTHAFRTDIQIHVGKHIDVHANGNDADAHKSVEVALSKLDAQIRRYKTRLLNMRRKKDDHSKIVETVQKFIVQRQEEDNVEDNPLVIAEVPKEILTLTVGDAVMKMDLSEYPVLVFKNAANDQINVVYKRPDNNIGWIDPSLKLS